MRVVLLDEKSRRIDHAPVDNPGDLGYVLAWQNTQCAPHFRIFVFDGTKTIDGEFVSTYREATFTFLPGDVFR